MRFRWHPGYAFVAPALGLLAVFFLLPTLAALVLSFTDFDVYAVADLRRLRLVGLANYVRLLHDARFWTALRNTVWFVLVAGPASIGVSLAAALLVDAKVVRGRAIFRTILFLPVVTTLVAVAVVWRYLYHPRYGLLNQLLGAVGIAPIDWLGDPAWALPALALLAVWKNFGFNMLIFLAGLQAIPERLSEAARLDGAGRWQELWHVTVPILAPTFVFVGVITTIGYLQLFAEPYVMTQGGPANSTLSVVLLMYEEGFRWWNLGYGAAVAFVLFALILTVSLLQLWLQRRALAGGSER
ncbi:MAG TPA: sugar ABC transporter permease [Candidatus Binatia bacterium]|nr:sugar ABC transporter permease [Candidatus Binatia bacterium]